MTHHKHQPDAEDILIKTIADHIKKCDFEDAAELIVNIPKDKLHLIIHQVSEQGTGVLLYTFANYMLQKNETSEWHFIACNVLYRGEIQHILNGSNAAIYHLEKAIEFSPQDVILKEYALSFYKKGILSKEKARHYAVDILKADTRNKLAREVLATFS